MSTEKLNVLYINHYDRSIDAASISSYEIIGGLMSLGHKVVVLTNDPYPNDEVEVSRIDVRFPIPVEKGSFLKFLRCTVAYFFVFLAGLKLCRRENIGCIFSQHHNFHLATLTACMLSAFLGKPYIVKVQDGVPEAWGRGSLRRIYSRHFMRVLNEYALKRATYILALSPEQKDLLLKMFRISKSQLVVAPNTISSLSVNSAKVKDVAKKLQLQSKRILIFVGNPEGRGVDVLIKALPQITSDVSGVVLLLVGGGDNYKALKDLSESIGVKDHVQFIGSVRHSLVSILVSMCDVAIGPLISFPFIVGAVPRKVLEYMACGKPVVCCYGSVSQHLLAHGYNGMLVRPRDINELSSVVVRLLKDEKLAKEIGSNAKKHVLRFYDCGVLIKKLATLMNTICVKNWGAFKGEDVRVD